MKNQSFFTRVMQNTKYPEGFWGRVMLRAMNCFHGPLSRRGMKLLPWDPSWNVLDVGCGGGANIRRILARCPHGKVYGIDASDESVSFARKHNSKELGKCCFIEKGNVCQLPFENESFDLVTAFETVYFWSPLSKGLDEVHRVLKKGGYFLVSMEVCDVTRGKVWSDRIDGLVVYPPRDMRRYLLKAGFSDVEVISRKYEAHFLARK